MKKLLAIVLAAVMIFSLAACTNTPGGTPAGTEKEEAAEDVTKEAEPAGEDAAPAAEAKDGELVVDPDPNNWPVISMEVNSFTDEQANRDKVQDALNEYLVSINAGFKAELIPIPIGERATRLPLMLTDSDEGIDLYTSRWYTTVSELVRTGQCISLEKYKDVYPELWEMFPAAVYDTCKINGELFGMPAANAFSNFEVYTIRKDIAEECGYADRDGELLTMDEWQDLMSKAEELHPEMAWVGDMLLKSLMGVDSLGDDNLIGVLMNRGLDETQIVNYYETEDFKNYCLMARDWEEKGYFWDDPVQVFPPSIDEGGRGAVAYEICSLIYAQSQMTSHTSIYDMCTFKLTEDLVGDNACVVGSWQISPACKDPDAAMKFIALAMTDENVANFLALGVEGDMYTVDENGCAWYAEGLSADNCGWQMIAPWWFPNQCLTHPFQTTVADCYTDMAAHWTDPTIKYSNGMGFVFDNTEVFDQLAACRSIVQEYRGGLLYGQYADVEGTIAQFTEELKKAGIDDVIAAMQAQFDEFLANK